MKKFHSAMFMLFESKAAITNLIYYGESFVSLSDEMNELLEHIPRNPWPKFTYK